MKTLWFYGKDEEALISLAEQVGEELINKDQHVEIIVHSEVQEILGRGLKDTKEDISTFIDRLGFLGNLLHRNNVFALIVSKDPSLNDRELIKKTYGNYIQVNLDETDTLCDIDLSKTNEQKSNVKKIIEYLINQKAIPEASHTVYSEEEEGEIRRRLEELGYV